MKQVFKSFRFSPAVYFLGFASFFTDVASESIYPLLPIFLTSVLGASPAFIGLVEGVAESTASLTKVLFGWISDRSRKREPFVLGGYGIANLVRPLIGLAMAPWHVLALRFTDRIGKGMRTAPRDAWLASVCSLSERGNVFGFHRAMDHAGAVLGPLLAAVFLWFYPGGYRPLFLLAFIPGILGVLSVAGALRTGKNAKILSSDQPKPVRISKIPHSFKMYLGVLLLFTLGNSSDAFLLLKLKMVGVQDKFIPLLWACLHIVKSVSSLFCGRFSDIVGRKPSILAGWVLYSAVYFSLGFLTDMALVITVFMVYGITHGLTEGPEKALVADVVPPEARGTAYGLFNGVIGITALPASLLFGYLWTQFGIVSAFLTGAALALSASFMLMMLRLGTDPSMKPGFVS
jgi:MFS family permease